MPQYVVLRNLSLKTAPRVRAAPFDTITAGAKSAEPPKPMIETHDLQPHEVAEMVQEAGVSGIARVMRTSLIKPFASASSNADEVWGISAIKAETSRYSGRGATVAVLDTGIDRSHRAFNDPALKITEKDFSGDEDGDVQGHGTHCAGTIFGRDVNGKRIGIARGVTKVLIGKVLKNDGGGHSNMIFDGLQWAVEQNAHVISMSLGFDFAGNVRALTEDGWPIELATSNSLEAYRANLRMFDALMQMTKARGAFGIEPVVVAATGNESKTDQDPEYKIAASLPAAAEGVISVGALQRSAAGFQVASFSNIFPQLSAPGVDIVSASAGAGASLRALSGTSMACPHVAGVAALWWEQIRKAGSVTPTGKAVVTKLRGTARADVFAPNVPISDRGDGLVTAPQ
jgi:subtilisin family serine protease